MQNIFAPCELWFFVPSSGGIELVIISINIIIREQELEVVAFFVFIFLNTPI